MKIKVRSIKQKVLFEMIFWPLLIFAMILFFTYFDYWHEAYGLGPSIPPSSFAEYLKLNYCNNLIKYFTTPVPYLLYLPLLVLLPGLAIYYKKKLNAAIGDIETSGVKEIIFNNSGITFVKNKHREFYKYDTVQALNLSIYTQGYPTKYGNKVLADRIRLIFLIDDNAIKIDIPGSLFNIYKLMDYKKFFKILCS
jgi:hypothetical protein